MLQKTNLWCKRFASSTWVAYGLSFFNGWLDWNCLFFQKLYIKTFTVVTDDLKVFLFQEIPFTAYPYRTFDLYAFENCL